MAASRIQRWVRKVAGDRWTSADANEISDVLADHADLIDSHTANLGSMEARIDSRNAIVAQHTTQITALQGRLQRVEKTGETASVSPNVLNAWAQPVTALVLTLVPGAAGEQCEYRLEFTVGGGAFTLTLTDQATGAAADVRWTEEPEWEDGYTYQVSIEDGLAIAAGWEAATTA